MTMKPTNIHSLNSDDLAGIYQDIAEAIGVENAKTLYNIFKGQQVTFPQKFISSSYITNKIKLEYNGHNAKELAQKYNFTERYVRMLAKKE